MLETIGAVGTLSGHIGLGGHVGPPLRVVAQVAPSDTWFTASPEWGWVIVVYFFLGGLAGGAAFLAAMFDLFGSPLDRAMARIGYAVAFVGVLIGGPLLIVDLKRPERFWHMLVRSDVGGLMFKWWSPISFGVWIVSLFGLFVTLALIGALATAGVLPSGLRVLNEGTLGTVIAALAGLLGLALGGYTGLVLAATNRPLWADTTLLGLLFLLSGISAGAAAMLLIGWRRTHPGSVAWLGQMDFYSSLIELVVLVVLAISLGSLVRPLWGNVWGAILIVGVVLLGLLIPMALHWRPRLLGRMSIPSAAVLVLLGSFLLRTVIILSSEAT